MTPATIILASLAALFAVAFVFAMVALVKAKFDRLRSEFAALAAEKLEEKAGDLSAKNARDVKPLFDALKQNIDEFRRAAEASRDANIKLGGELGTRIEEVGRKAQSLGKQADDFVTALRGGNKIQGNWGEGIVRNVLEGAGLKAGVDFLEQSGARDAGRPDFIVKYGEHSNVVIDAKVNIDSFLAAIQAANEGRNEEADGRMKEHARSVRAQITGLASKKYPVKLKASDPDVEAEYSPVVIMAMPSEATYAAALSADPEIGAFANANNIVLASPQMLFGYLVLFKLVIDRLKVDRNNQEIAKRADQLITRMDAAFVALEGIGASLDKAQEQYHNAMKKLGGEGGGQNILVPAKELAKFVNIDSFKSNSMQS
jgi:DNA recombination protein RmuC